MKNSRVDIKEAFEREHRELCYNRAKLILVLALLSNALFAVTDYFFSSTSYLSVVMLRGGMAFFLALTLIFLKSFRDFSLKYSSAIILALALFVGSLIIPQSLLTGGFDSFYSSGFIYILLLTAGVLPWRARFQLAEALLFDLLFLSQGFFVGLNFSSAGFMTYIWIISAVGALTSITSYLQYKLRYQIKETEAELVRAATLSAVGELVAGLAHNVNSYMSGADLGLSLILKQIEDQPGIHQLAKTSLESVRHTKELVGTLEDFAQKKPEQFYLADIREGLESAIRMFKLNPKAYGISIHRETEGPLWLMCDLQQINAILINLFENSVRAGAKNIWIQAVQQNGSLSLKVRDDGCGMSEELQKRIFEPFFTTRDIGEGSGLGLWTVWRTIDQHRGKVSVKSRTGEGTEFQIMLPRDRNTPISWTG